MINELITTDAIGVKRHFSIAVQTDYVYLIMAIPSKRVHQEAIPIPKVDWEAFKQLINEQGI